MKFSHRDMASAAIDALNGKFTMRVCFIIFRCLDNHCVFKCLLAF